MGTYYITTNNTVSPFFYNPYAINDSLYSSNSSINLYKTVKEPFYNSEYKTKLVPDKNTKMIDVE